MAATVEELTITQEEGPRSPAVKELDKQPLAKGGAWLTLMFKYQEFDEKTDDWGEIKYTVRRYQKRNGEYKQRSKFNISNVAQAEKIVEILQAWVLADKEASSS